MGFALHNRAEKLSSLLPPLLIDAERVANSVWQGVHGRRRSGVGESFWQFRRYDAGDPATRIDWRQSARTDNLFVREREWEAAQSLCIWADNSGSMHYASDKSRPTKVEHAQLLSLALASLAMRGGEKVLWAAGHQFKPVNRKSGLEEISRRMKGSTHHVPQPPQLRHAHMVLASDFLMPETTFNQTMQACAAQNLRGVLLHVIDPLEESFALDGRIELQGAEGEASLLLSNATSVRDAYHQRFVAHQARLQHAASSAGWFYLRHVTSTPPQQTLLRLYQYLKG